MSVFQLHTYLQERSKCSVRKAVSRVRDAIALKDAEKTGNPYNEARVLEEIASRTKKHGRK